MNRRRWRHISPGHFGGSPISLLIYTADCDAVYARALAAGAEGLREPADQPYGDRMSGIRDPFGYKWYIATHIKDVSYEEMGCAELSRRTSDAAGGNPGGSSVADRKRRQTTGAAAWIESGNAVSGRERRSGGSGTYRLRQMPRFEFTA